MSPLNTLRTQWSQIRTRALRMLAAPDRRRRRLRIRQWQSAYGSTDGSAVEPERLASDGFSMATLKESVERNLLSDWATLKSGRGLVGERGQAPRQTGKLFFEELLSVDDLGRLPAFLATAIDEHALISVANAMGMVPHLESVDILASRRTGDGLSASQLWHYDVNDERILKLFVYLEDTWAMNGPFTYVDAGASRRASGMLGHYVSDDRIAAHVPRDQWRVVEGRAGTAFFTDTGRCYHFGSRCELPRYAYIATYSSGLKFMKRSTVWRDVLGERASELSRLQLDACGLA